MEFVFGICIRLWCHNGTLGIWFPRLWCCYDRVGIWCLKGQICRSTYTDRPLNKSNLMWNHEPDLRSEIDFNFILFYFIICMIDKHATRASLPPHLFCIMNFVNGLLLVWYIGSHRKKLWNQTLENFWENAILIFLMQKIGIFLQVLNILFALVQYFWLLWLN